MKINEPEIRGFHFYQHFNFSSPCFANAFRIRHRWSERGWTGNREFEEFNWYHNSGYFSGNTLTNFQDKNILNRCKQSPPQIHVHVLHVFMLNIFFLSLRSEFSEQSENLFVFGWKKEVRRKFFSLFASHEKHCCGDEKSIFFLLSLGPMYHVLRYVYVLNKTNTRKENLCCWTFFFFGSLLECFVHSCIAEKAIVLHNV